ncbi:hypothetical protein FPS14_contig00025-0041 [Flavobacterium psychrophilum]|nr:hypothetical protein FPS14_contig00025-0041 [Flavobacterium psychrophilum]
MLFSPDGSGNPFFCAYECLVFLRGTHTHKKKIVATAGIWFASWRKFSLRKKID